MTNFHVLFRLACACLLGLVPLHGLAACAETRDIQLDFPVADLKALRLQALAGSLEVRAGPDDRIILTGQACAANEQLLAAIGIRDHLEDNILELVTLIPVEETGWGKNYAYLDLEVELPGSLATHIKDSSGNAEIRGITLASINDSSGDLRLTKTRGPTELRDASGHIVLREHEGDLRVQDSSGDMELRQITGNLVIWRDSSGDIEIDTVSGLVQIERDSSGDIDIENTGENVEIAADGSGSIRIMAIKGSVTIGRDGSGDVRVSKIGGDLTIDTKGDGRIRISDVEGSVDVPDRS